MIGIRRNHSQLGGSRARDRRATCSRLPVGKRPNPGSSTRLCAIMQGRRDRTAKVRNPGGPIRNPVCQTASEAIRKGRRGPSRAHHRTADRVAQFPRTPNSALQNADVRFRARHRSSLNIARDRLLLTRRNSTAKFRDRRCGGLLVRQRPRRGLRKDSRIRRAPRLSRRDNPAMCRVRRRLPIP